MNQREIEHETGTCVSCKAEGVRLVGIAAKLGGKICDACFTKFRQTGLPFDQYDLRPDEMTVEMLMDKAGGITRRTVQNWNRQAKIPFTLERRRTAGSIRKQVVYKRQDADAFLAAHNEPVSSPTVQNGNANSGANAVSPTAAFDLIEKLATVMSRQPHQSHLAEMARKMFLSIDEAAIFSGIARSRIAVAIHDAEAAGLIQHYTGDHGRSVYRAEQIEFVIGQMPPTPKRLGPKRDLSA